MTEPDCPFHRGQQVRYNPDWLQVLGHDPSDGNQELEIQSTTYGTSSAFGPYWAVHLAAIYDQEPWYQSVNLFPNYPPPLRCPLEALS